jgi:hypothetical protein
MAENAPDIFGVSEDFADLLPKVASLNGPLYHLWVFDPEKDRVIIETPEEKPRSEHRYHVDLAEDVPHPERVHGYAYPIKGGWRITDWEHRPIEDPHIKQVVKRTLDREKIGHPKGGREARLVLRSRHDS